MTVITGTTGTATGTRFLRLVSGQVVSATLTLASWKVAIGHTVALTLTTTDGFGNSPLDNSVFIHWTASGGTATLTDSPVYDGVGRTAFIAGCVPGPAVITATVGTESITAVTISVFAYQHYLPVILRNDDC